MSLLKEKKIKSFFLQTDSMNNMQEIVLKIMPWMETRFRFNSAYIVRDCISIFYCLHVAWGRLVKLHILLQSFKLSRPTNYPPTRNSVVVSFFTRWHLALGLLVVGGEGGRVPTASENKGKLEGIFPVREKPGNLTFFSKKIREKLGNGNPVSSTARLEWVLQNLLHFVSGRPDKVSKSQIWMD